MAFTIRHRNSYGNFDVSTGLFDGYMETRVFHNVGDGKVPREIVEKIEELSSTLETLDTVTHEFSDEPALMTYAFVDAETAHSAVCDVVKTFNASHTMTVTYVRS